MELFSASDSVSRFPPVPPLVHCSMIHSPNSSSVSHCHHASSSSSLASAAKQTHSDSSSVDNITESPITLSSLRCEAQSQSSGKSPACAVKKEANMEVDPTQFDKLRLKMKTFLATIGTDLSPTKSRQSSGSTCTHNSRSCEHQDSQSSRGSLPPPDPDTEDRNLESGVLMIEHNDSVLDELLESDVDNMKKMYPGSSGTGTSQELETDSRHTGAEESVRENRIETSLANTDPCDSNFNCELFSDETRTNIVITMDKAAVDGATTQKNETFETVSTKISNDEDKMRNHDSLVDITHTCLTCRKHFALSDLLEEHLLEHTESQVDDLQTPADTASLCDTVSQEINLEPNLDSNKRDDKSMVVKMEFSKRVPTKEKIWTFVDKRAKSLSCSTDSVDNEKLFDNHCEQVSSHDTFLPKALKTNPGSSTQAVCSILKHSSAPSASVSLDSPAHCASSVKSRQEHVPKPLILKTSPNRTKSQDSSAVSKQVPEKAAGLKSNQHDSAKSVSKTCHQDALKNPLSKLSSKDTNRSSSSNSEKQHGSHSRLAKSSNVNSQTSTTEKLPQDISKPTTPKSSGNHTNRHDSSTPKTHVQEKQTSSSLKTSRSAKSENNSDAAKPIDKDSHARKSPKFGDDSCWKVLSNGQIFRVGSRRKSIESCDYSQCFIEEMRNADYEASSSPKETVPVSKYTPQVRPATQTGDRSESVDHSGSVPKGGDNGLAPRDKTVQEAKTKPLTASDTKVKSETCRIDRKCEVGAKACSVKKSVSVDSAPSAKHTCDRDADVGTKAGVKTVQVVKTKPHTASHSKSETPRSNGKAEVEAKPGGVKKSVSIDSAPSAKETCEGTESSRGLKRSHSETVDHKDHDASQAKPRKHTYSVPKELPKKNHKRGSDIGMASRDKHVLEVIDKTKPQTASNTTVKSETCRNNRNSEVGAKPGGVKKSVSVDSAPSVKKTCVELEGSRNLKRSHSETVDHKDPDAYKTKARKHTDTANGKSVPNEQPKKNHKNCEMSSKKHFKDSERSSSNCAKSAEKHDLISDGSSHRQLSSSRTERSGSSGKSGESKKYCIGDTDQKRHLSADDCSNSSKSNAKKLKTDVSNDSSSSQHGVPVRSDGSFSTKRRHKSTLQSEIERKVCDLARVVLEKRSARTLTLSVESQPEDRAVFKRSNKTEDKATAEQHYSKKRANSYDHDSSRNSSKKKQSNSGEGSQAADDSASIEQKTSSSKDTVGSKGSTSLREKSTANKITLFSSTDSDKPSSKPPARKYRSAKAVALERSAAKTNLEKTPPHVKDDSNVSKFSTEKHVTEMDTHSDTYISSQKIRPVVDKSSSSDKVVERRRPGVKPILGPIAIDNDVCFEFCTNCQTIFTSRVKYGQHTCVTLTWDSTEDDSNNSDAGKDAELVLKGKSRKNRDGEDNTKGESNNTASKSESNDGDGNVETCRPDNHHRKSTEGRLTSLHKSSKTGSDKSSKTGSDKSSKTGSDKSSKTGSDKSSKTGSDKSSKTGSDKSSKTGSDKSSKTGSDKSSKTGSDKSSKTGSDKSSKTGNDKSSKTGNDKSSKTGSDKSSKTGSDKSSKTGNDKSSKTGSDKSSKTDSDKHNSGKTRDTSEKPNDNSEKTTHNSGKTRDSSEKPNDSSETRHNSGKTRDSSEKPNDNSEKRKDESRKSKDKSGKTADKSEKKKDISGKTNDKSCGRASKSQCNEDNDLKSHRQSSATSSDGKERTKDNSRERSSKTDQQMFSCEKCNEKYSSRGGLLHHLRNYHMKK
ncbi:dentin sialophosphoprotein-like [Littorina saxatilis]|uniref:dentin sialophosphoprotein-like n=1 Tax=Littorina saxatilis TaxID=31220 RepID=UPI0038B673B6